jgi:hypothetical protein
VRLIKADIMDDLLIRNARTLGAVATHASGSEVPPGIGAAVMARDDVIDLKLYVWSFRAAVSASMIIAAKYLKPDAGR